MIHKEIKKRGRPSKHGLKRLQHCVYNIHYHIVFTTKYRKKVINPEVFTLIKKIITHISKEWNCELIEINGEEDHLHLLVSAPPNLNLSQFIGNIKTISSRTVRQQFKEYIATFYWKPYFWNKSYCILSTGGAPIEVIKKYIEAQANRD